MFKISNVIAVLAILIASINQINAICGTAWFLRHDCINSENEFADNHRGGPDVIYLVRDEAVKTARKCKTFFCNDGTETSEYGFCGYTTCVLGLLCECRTMPAGTNRETLVEQWATRNNLTKRAKHQSS